MSSLSADRFRPLLAALLGVAALAACSNITENDVTLSNYGAVTITAKNAPAGRATATINAVFFQGVAATAPNSVLQQGDQCAYALIDSVTGGATGSLKVGESLALSFAGASVAMPFSSGVARYEPATGVVLSYAPTGSSPVTRISSLGTPPTTPRPRSSSRFATGRRPRRPCRTSRFIAR